MIKYSSLESEYLIHLLRCALKSEKPEKAPDGLDWNALFELSKSQQVYSVITPVIDLNSVPAEFSQELELYSQTELLRMLAMKSELDGITEDLNEMNIPFMLVKGSVIRNYYPLQKMRQMSDVDILYKKENQKELIAYMKKRGYRLRTSEANSDDFSKPPYYTFEFHRCIFDERDAFSPDFDLWKRAVQDSERTAEYHINDEDMLIYALCHMYDHYCVAGCGIRFVCDIYVLMNSFENLDWNYINKTFSDFNFKPFCDTAIGLSKAVFGEKEIAENEQKLLDFIMSGGVYGTQKSLDEVIEQKYNGSKFKYILKRMFPPSRQMKSVYPILSKLPFLLPFFYPVRIIQSLKYSKKTVKKEINSLKKHKQ
ncbi:MAG: nucleotidyltransferase family protein [Eubacteriales bacterium]|nr:nucleotidyltransferase family protein [Eubacteriales bacterium]